MVLTALPCPQCGDTKTVSKYGFTKQGKQRYCCGNESCPTQTFLTDYSYKGCQPDIEKQVVDMAMNASGIRDTARILEVAPATVINKIKSRLPAIKQVNEPLLATLNLAEVTVMVIKVEDLEAEADEMWSYVSKKDEQRWLWHAIDHATGKVLAYVFGNHKDAVFLQLKKLLEPFGIVRFYTDNWGAYQRHIEPAKHVVGKRNTQKIERKHLTFRTRLKRLARKTICFSKSILMHDLVIGLFLNRYEFGLPI